MFTAEKWFKFVCGLVIVISIVTGILLWDMTTNYEKPLVSEKPNRLTGLITYVSEKYNVPENTASAIVNTVYSRTNREKFPKPELVLAVIATESSFNVNAKSSVGAKGLMQVMPVHGHPRSFVENIDLGIKILKEYRKHVATDEQALMAYNIGISRFHRGGRSFGYVKRVQIYHQEFTSIVRV